MNHRVAKGEKTAPEKGNVEGSKWGGKGVKGKSEARKGKTENRNYYTYINWSSSSYSRAEHDWYEQGRKDRAQRG